MLTDLKVSVKKVNEITVAAAVLFCLLVLMASYSVGNDYSMLRENLENLLDLQRAAYNLQSGSDELTEQVRSYADTGDRAYMEGYFTEANVTKRRDNAVKKLEENHGESDAYLELQQAMTESVKLMDREFYSMRLMSEAMGYSQNTLPAEIRNVRLTAEDQKLSSDEKMVKARQYVIDEKYREEKRLITEHMTGCIEALNRNLEAVQQKTTERLNMILVLQKFMIIGMIISILALFLSNHFLLIRPLVRAVELIKAEKSIPMEGSREFQFLATAYNMIFGSYKEKTKLLAHEASHDSLTGIYNRSAFENLMGETDLKDCVLLIVDVDEFKSFNDQYGHEMGDRVLTEVSGVIKRYLNERDEFRVGGDEFAVLLYNVNPETAKLVKEKVEEINEELMSSEEGRPPVSISVGGAYGVLHEDVQELMNAADRALYAVKHKGGRGCEFADTVDAVVKQMFNI